MKHLKITAFDCPDAWFKVLNNIWKEGETFKVGYGSEVTETKKLNLSIEINCPENRPLVADKAPCDMKYVQWYALTYLWCGEGKLDEIYTYGSRLREPVNQIDEAIDRYVQERQDRQVTMVVRLPTDVHKFREGTKERHEPPCLSLIDTEILDDRLHLTCYFRSWDAYEEHDVGKQIINDIDMSDKSEEDRMLAKIKVLSENIDMHVKEEEDELFKKAKKVLSHEDEREIGRLFEEDKMASMK